MTTMELPSTYGSFCWELVPYDFPLVVLHIIVMISFHLWCMLGGSVWIWIWMKYFGPLRAKLILAPLGMPKWVRSSTNLHRMFFVQTSTLPPSMHHKLTYWTWKLLYAKQRLLSKNHVELENNSSIPSLFPNFLFCPQGDRDENIRAILKGLLTMVILCLEILQPFIAQETPTGPLSKREATKEPLHVFIWAPHLAWRFFYISKIERCRSCPILFNLKENYALKWFWSS